VPDGAGGSDDPDGVDVPGHVEVPSTDGDIDGSEVPATPVDSFESWLERSIVTPEGLDLAPLPSSDPFASLPLLAFAGQSCTDDECPGWVLGVGFHHPTDPRTVDGQNGSGKKAKE
jgi:hypothetical protein